MSIIQGIGPREAYMGQEPLSWNIPRLKDAIKINVSAGGSFQQSGENISYTINSGVGPTPRDGIFVTWNLEDIIGNHVTRESDGLGTGMWMHRIASIVDPLLTSDVDITVLIGNQSDVSSMIGLAGGMGGGVRFSGTPNVLSFTLEGATTNTVLDSNPTGNTRQCYGTYYELFPNFPGPMYCIGLSLSGVFGDSTAVYFNQGILTGPLYFSVLIYRNNIATPGVASGVLKPMYHAVGPLSRNYAVTA